MVNWDQWQTLLAIYRCGTYVRAAQVLGLDATTVGRRIKLLEKQVGEELFVRDKSRLHPTARCEVLLSHVETASEALRTAEQGSATAESGSVWRSLLVTAPPFVVKSLIAPRLNQFTDRHRVYIELMGTGSNVSLSRRETDIALRIEDNPAVLSAENARVDAEKIGVIRYAIYGASGADGANLPWAGLKEQYLRTSGSQVMAKLAGSDGFMYRVYQFDALAEIVASGVARAMLPCFVADADGRLECIETVALEQPLWMLSHRQDRSIPHQAAARDWLSDLAGQMVRTA